MSRPEVAFHVSGDGAPLLLLNGWTASGLAWPSAWLRRLERHHRVIRIDNRGSGWSRTAPAPFTIADLADDTHRVLRMLDVPPATVLGLSMGGMIAQELALRRPGDVHRLVLVATGPPAPHVVAASAEITAHMFLRPRAGQPLAGYLRDLWTVAFAPDFPHREPELVDELVDQLVTRPTPRSAAMTQARAAAAWCGAHRLRRIQAPTTIVHGALDVLRPVQNGRNLCQLIPGSRYLQLPDVGHLVPLEAGDLLADLLENA